MFTSKTLYTTVDPDVAWYENCIYLCLGTRYTSFMYQRSHQFADTEQWWLSKNSGQSVLLLFRFETGHFPAAEKLNSTLIFHLFLQHRSGTLLSICHLMLQHKGWHLLLIWDRTFGTEFLAAFWVFVGNLLSLFAGRWDGHVLRGALRGMTKQLEAEHVLIWDRKFL